MKRLLIIVAALLTMGLQATGAQHADAAAGKQLARAQHKATVDRDLRGAIEEYKKAFAAAGANRALAAQVLIEMAECYTKLGDAEARNIYEQVVSAYADQRDAVALARAKLGNREASARVRERSAWNCQGTDAANENVQDVSGDGRHLAVWKQGNVLIRDLRTCADRILVSQEKRGATVSAYPLSPVFSRDGRHVAYNWRRQDALPIVDELRIISLDGDAERAPRMLIQDNQTSGYGIRPLDWSPDGRRIFVSIGHLEDGIRQLGYVDVATGTLRVLRSLEWRGPAHVAVSPDGKYVAYDLPASEQLTQRDVLILATDGSSQISVGAHPANDELVGWAADGRVLFVSDRFGSRGLWAQSIRDGKLLGDPVLLRSSLPGAVVDLSDSGDLLMRIEVGGYTLHTVAIDFATGKRLAPPAAVALSRWGLNPPADWSPDGKLFAYLSSAADGSTVMAIQTVDNAQTRTLPLHVAAVLAYRWTPDGRAFIAQAADFKNRVGIVRIDAATGEVTPIAMPAAPTRYTRPQLSPDGSTLYYFASVEQVVDGQVVRSSSFVEREVSSGAEKTVLKLAGRPSAAFGALSPDGRYLGAVVVDKPATAISVMSVTTGAEKELFRVVAPEEFLAAPAVEWTPDSRAMLVRKAVGANREVWIIPVEGGDPRKVDLGVPNYSGFQVRISPDGRQIAFTAGDQPKREFRVLENVLSAPMAKR